MNETLDMDKIINKSDHAFSSSSVINISETFYLYSFCL